MSKARIHQLKLNYVKHFGIKDIDIERTIKLFPESRILFCSNNIAIFCDSEFFHGKDWEVLKSRLEKGHNPDYWIKKIERNRNRDMENDKKLLFMGWTVIHFWGKDILKNTDECIKLIEETVWDIHILGE